MRLPRLIISAPHRSSGKTTLSIGLCSAFGRSGLDVRPFKKGPDFIDPMWLGAATGHDCHNLDLFMMGENRIRQSFYTNGRGADLALIEGNMGLYDSIEVDGKGSTADMGRTLDAPVLLVINCRNMTRSVAPLIQGFTRFEPDVKIAAVILNKVSGPRHEEKLRRVIERYCDIEVVGAVRRSAEMSITMRHLGLEPAPEALASAAVIGRVEKAVSDSVDLERILAIAASAPDFPGQDVPDAETPRPLVRLGVARDRAFTFYYPENLDALRTAGAELVPFSPLDDSSLPAGICGLYIGGGFPEVFLRQLEGNALLRREIRKAAADGMPIYAECGGLMYLARKISWKDKSGEMAGALPCDIAMHEKPRGHGYITLKTTGAGGWFAPGALLKGHEFHYSEVTALNREEYAYEVIRGTGLAGGNDGIIFGNVLASYAHLHALGSPAWAPAFINRMMDAGFRT